MELIIHYCASIICGATGNSNDRSKPPSSDFLKKSEKAQVELSEEVR